MGIICNSWTKPPGGRTVCKRGWSGVAAESAELAELALVNQVDQLTHQVDDVTTDQLMTTPYWLCHTVRNLHFLSKIQLWFSEKIVDFLGWKTRENVVVLDFLAVDNFDFTRKIVKKIWVKNSWICWGFGKIEFLDKNLTFRIVC